MSDSYDQPDGTAARHQTARELAEQAIRAQVRGDDDEADRLFAEASRIDPEAVSNALANAASDPSDSSTGADAEPQDDAEIEAMSRTMEPGADAPSRSGVSGRGSGADTEGS